MNRPRCLDPELIVPISRKTTADFKTGAWSSKRPVYLDKISPCRAACPVGNDLARALALASRGDLDAALAVFLEETPLPSVCGHVCYHPCEESCNQGEWDGSIYIRALERAVSLYGKALPRPLGHAGAGKPVVVVGSGPAGLSGAYHLARLGHPVTVLEAGDAPGGLLRTALPAFRLPQEALDRDLARFSGLPIELKTGPPVRPGDLKELLNQYRAVFLALGAAEPLRPNLPGAPARGVVTGLEFLQGVRRGELSEISGQVAVVGGGNVAVDAALTALRLGADQVEMVSLEQEDQLPAHEEELKGALEEGVKLSCGWGPARVDQVQGRIKGLELVRCVSVLDMAGNFAPIYDPKQTRRLEVDFLILAVGQMTLAPEFLEEALGRETDLTGVNPETLAAGVPGLYLGGDFLTGPASVTEALAAGKRAAAAIHLDLTGKGESVTETLLGQGPAFSITALFQGRDNWNPGKAVRFQDLDPLFLGHQKPVGISTLDFQDRKHSFDPIEKGLTPDQAVAEAGRCFNCGTCVGCDSCFVFCPDGSIQRPQEAVEQYGVDPDYCKGCGVCAVVCSRGVVSLEDKP